MKDKTLVGGIVVMVVGVILIGVVWFIFLRPAGTPSEPIAAIPLELADASNYTIFEIVPAQSEVTFTMGETLRGLPTTVVGNSREVAGQIAINFADLPTSQLGPVLINARTLLTDNEFRNNAIQNFILDTENYEYITFRPNEITGIPNSFASGESVTLQIEGMLTIRDISQPVTFSATVTQNGRSEVVGSATAQISRSDFDLQIPNAPGVADVDEKIVLSLEFQATLLE